MAGGTDKSEDTNTFYHKTAFHTYIHVHTYSMFVGKQKKNCGAFKEALVSMSILFVPQKKREALELV